MRASKPFPNHPSTTHPQRPLQLPLLALALALAGCATSLPTQPLPPDAGHDSHRVELLHRTDDVAGYRAEHDYILERRGAAAALHGTAPCPLHAHHPVTGRPPVGLALSGGGLRSATFNLGVLQALQRENVLPHIDYLSTVSGGSYIASWYTSHLLPPGSGQQNGGTYTDDIDQLLGLAPGLAAPSRDPVLFPAQHQLYDERHFVFGAYGSKLPYRLGSWLARYPAHFTFDVALHFKPTRGKFNRHHPTYVYRRAIYDTYLQDFVPPGSTTGEPRSIHLAEINPPGHQAPYLVLNASLQNAPVDGVDKHGNKKKFNHLFEFTRDHCGSSLTGFIPTSHFDKPVHTVYHTPDGQRATHTLTQPSPWPILPPTADFTLGTAVAASGAAFDAGKDPEVTTKDYIQRFLNVNLRYQTRNFAMDGSREHTRDRLREVTGDRYRSAKGSNTLYISDGGHHDNLGVVALVRRLADPILVSDASRDASYEYGSLGQSVAAVEREVCSECCKNLVWTWIGPDPTKLPAGRPDNPLFHAQITCPCGHHRHRVIYAKSSWRKEDAKPARGFPDDLVLHPVADGHARHVAANPSIFEPVFPHVSTGWLAFNKEQYDAYRLVGYYLGRRLAVASKRRP